MILGLLVGAWVARYLGPTLYGELAFVLTYLAFFQVISFLGMNGIIVRDISKNPNEAPTILGTAFFLQCVAGLLCWILAIIIMAIIYGWADLRVVLTAIIGSILVFQSSDTIDLWFQSQSQSKRTVLAKLIAYIISNSLKVILILSESPLTYFAFITALEGLIGAVSLFYAYKKYPCPLPWSIIPKKIIILFKESWTFVLSGLTIIIYMRIDIIMIEDILGTEQLGIYAAMLPLSTLWHVIPMSIYTSLMPYISRLKIENEEKYKKTLAKVFLVYSILGWLICIPIYFLSPFLIRFLYGEQYALGGDILSIYIFTNLFICSGVALGFWVLNERKGHLSLIRTSLGALFLVSINFYLIPKYGLIGAAISAVLTQAFSTILLNIIFSPSIFKVQILSLFLIKSRYKP
ncbi:flippase [Providencia stuartii]|nr:flippase [Providencia stuartii]MBN4875832.1 flippase [Providencia stuartii]MBN4880524.1 flippase [Providencia stuartii]MBN4885032.1 flippase [Providencia stuartii]